MVNSMGHSSLNLLNSESTHEKIISSIQTSKSIFTLSKFRAHINPCGQKKMHQAVPAAPDATTRRQGKTQKRNKTQFKMMHHGLLGQSFTRYDEMVCEK